MWCMVYLYVCICTCAHTNPEKGGISDLACVTTLSDKSAEDRATQHRYDLVYDDMTHYDIS